MKIAILSNGPGNYSTKRLKEVAESRGHEVDIIKYKNAYISIDSKNPKVIVDKIKGEGIRERGFHPSKESFKG